MVLRIPDPIRDGVLPCGRPRVTAAPVAPSGVRPCRTSTPDRVKFARPSTQPIPDPAALDPSAPDLSPPDPAAPGPSVPDPSVPDPGPTDLDQAAAGAGAADHAGPEVDTAAWELVAAAQQGDQNAFGQLYDRYVDVVFRFVLFRVGDRPLAEDLTSETFLRALRRISSVSYQGRDVGAWFVTIARNLVLDHVKSSRYRLEMTTADILDSSADDRGPEQEVVEEATATELMRCVAQLGRDQQECIMLRFMQGLSVSETASVMGRNEGAVKALQHRAVRRLAQLLPEGLR
jgi:RNA polymerase sigma-70 factor (ECF subfamily)